MIEIREVQLHWRASALTLALATCTALALAVALIGSCWQLVAFAAPLLGVLCSISWQRPMPKINVHAEPDSQRCFETEQAQLTVTLNAADRARLQLRFADVRLQDAQRLFAFL